MQKSKNDTHYLKNLWMQERSAVSCETLPLILIRIIKPVLLKSHSISLNIGFIISAVSFIIVSCMDFFHSILTFQFVSNNFPLDFDEADLAYHV
jgi:hypothetical protein